MATGRSNQLTKQIGEYLVACELARRGYLVATFSGNVPDFDLIVTGPSGTSAPIQVKTSKGANWQFSIDKFVDITFDNHSQILGAKKPLQIPHLVCVFVVAGDHYGEDRFFVIEWAQLQDRLIAHHAQYLQSHGGIRPRVYDSLHCSVPESMLADCKDQWATLTSKLASAP
jgi:hypothetical protein